MVQDTSFDSPYVSLDEKINRSCGQFRSHRDKQIG